MAKITLTLTAEDKAQKLNVLNEAGEEIEGRSVVVKSGETGEVEIDIAAGEDFSFEDAGE